MVEAVQGDGGAGDHYECCVGWSGDMGSSESVVFLTGWVLNSFIILLFLIQENIYNIYYIKSFQSILISL